LPQKHKKVKHYRWYWII